MKKILNVLLCSALLIGTAACSTVPKGTTEPTPTTFTAGTYQGEYEGRNGLITVEVTLSESAIESVNVISHQESEGVSDLAIERIPNEIVEYQSLGVDLVSGATITSACLINAVANAIDASGTNSSDLRNVEVNKELAPVEDLTTQIVIAGGGVSGMLAAFTAAAEGMDVTLVEKLDFLGGSLMVSGAFFTTVDSEVNEQNDDLDRTMDFYKANNATSVHQPDYEFTANLFSHTGETIDFMVNDLGLTGAYVDNGSYVGTQFTDGYTLCRTIVPMLEEKGVKVITSTEATEIIVENDEVTGIKVSSKAGDYNIYADKVIIATGGASWDKELINEKNPVLSVVDFNEKASIGNTGDGMKMLEAIGADMAEDLYIKSSAPDCAEAYHYTWRTVPKFGPTLIIDAEGYRFTNEAPVNQNMINSQMWIHESPAYYAIFDEATMSETLKEDSQKFLDDPKIVVYGKTMDELAEKLNMDAAVLNETFSRYQTFCENGVDEDYGKSANNLVKFSEEGYYAVYIRTASYGSIGGVIVDEQQHVLRPDGTIIENVFAVGETATAQLFGDFYFGGFSLGLYAAAGRVAAQTAVAEINQ